MILTVLEADILVERDFPEVSLDEIARRQAAATARRVAQTAKISCIGFFNRFTDTEKAAIYAAATTNPALGVGLIHGLANGTVDLTSPELRAWVDGLVSAGAITADRKTAILTP